MRLIFVGCEYSGTTTLANSMGDWMFRAFGQRSGLHDHWKIPHISGHPPHEIRVTLPTEEEKKQVLSASPVVKELLMRYALYYHTPSLKDDSHGMLVGYHIEDKIYGPHYFGYGEAGQPGDRTLVAHDIEQRISKYAPSTVLVLVKASMDVILQRMEKTPHQYQVVPPKDVEYISSRFQEEFEQSQIHNKIIIDTSKNDVGATNEELLNKVETYMTSEDRISLVARAKTNQQGLHP